jgi:hypothetical protein
VEQHERDRLVEVMGWLAAGDRAAVVALYVEFGGRIVAVVRRQLRHLNVDAVTRDDLEGLVLDACFAVADCAGGWDAAGGAAPWTWAERRIASVVSSFVGQHADGLDGTEHVPVPPSASGDEPEPLALLGRSDLPVCRVLEAALDEAGLSVRDRRLLLDVELQRSLGDTSPALTVAPLYDMSAVAVRQAVKRSKDRLRRLAAEDRRFEPLADLALLA